jgi:phospholipase D1/2
VREVEALYVDAIAAARRWIYAENQYLTSARIAEALAARLREPHGPEVVVVGPRTCSGWLEEKTMGRIRAGVVRGLREADRHGRLRIFCPVIPQLGSTRVNVHSKVMVVDDRSARVGSANLSNRSMGFDTECDLLVEDDGRPETRAAIAGLANRLLAEHLDATPEKVAAALAETGSLIRTIEALGGGRPNSGRRTLEPLDCELPDSIDAFLPDVLPADPPEPIAGGTAFAKVMEEEALIRRPLGRALGGALLLLAIAAAWRLGFFIEAVAPGWASWVALQAARAPESVGLVLAAFLLSGTLFLPRGPLVVLAGMVFGPLRGFGYALLGGAVGALAGYVLGRSVARNLVLRLTHGRFHRIRRFLPARGPFALAAFRWVPAPPFALANLLAGAQRMRFRDYLLGTAIELVPTTLALSLLSLPARDLLRDPEPSSFAALFGLALVFGVAGALIRRSLERRRLRRME